MSTRGIAVLSAVCGLLLLQSASALGAHAQVDLVSAGTSTDAKFRIASRDQGRALFTTFDSLSPTDTDGSQDLYRWSGGQPELISIGTTGGNGAFGVGGAEMSAEGSHVFFNTFEQLTAEDIDSRYDVYERFAGQTRLVSIGPSGGNGNGAGHDAFLQAVSADGTRAYFRTREGLVHPGDLGFDDLDIYERRTDPAGGQTRLVTGDTNFEPDQISYSEDGTRVVFGTRGRLVAADTDDQWDVYVYEDGTLRVVSTGPIGGNGPFGVMAPGPDPTLTPIYRGVTKSLSHVYFYTNEQLTSDDADTSTDLYEHEYATGTTRLFSDGPSCPAPCPQFAPADWVAVSRDASATFFLTTAQLGPADTDGDYDLYRRTSSGYALVSAIEPGSACCVQALPTYLTSSPGGDRVIFRTAEYLTADDQNPPDCVIDGSVQECRDIYQRWAGDTELLSGAGSPNPSVGFDTTFAGASRDARRVFFFTDNALVSQDTDTRQDLYERNDGVTSLVSVGPSGGNGPHDACPTLCLEKNLSDDGSKVFFETAERLVAADTDDALDVYVATDTRRYPRPKSASPTIVSLVPAYAACTASDRHHGPPLAYPACSSPDPASSHLTVGTPDANGRAAKSAGYVRYGGATADPATPADEADVRFFVTLDDVRLASDLSDYEGELQLRTQVRITDRGSGPAANEPATVGDFDFLVTVPCSATTDATVGADCGVATTAEAIIPGALTERDRAIWALGQARLYDGGPDGVASTSDNELFVVSGLFVP